MKVRATARGFYGRLYEPGMEFVLADESHLGSWMVPVDPKDCERLSANITRLRKGHRHSAGPDVPATTALIAKHEFLTKLQPKANRKGKDAPVVPVVPVAPAASAPGEVSDPKDTPKDKETSKAKDKDAGKSKE